MMMMDDDGFKFRFRSVDGIRSQKDHKAMPHGALVSSTIATASALHSRVFCVRLLWSHPRGQQLLSSFVVRPR